ncbi:hypothetical protein C0989_002460 [Termitomyces sp. Mn162]|nr:hypothetical protein C0989_002460 [Termitomyces sp. Mn162]
MAEDPVPSLIFTSLFFAADSNITGNQVTVNVDTLYPFSDTLNTTITATSAFTYYVRIPSWVINGTISINGRAAEALSPSNGLQAVAAAAGTTTFVLNLPAEITTVARNQTVLARNAKQPLAVDLEFDATAAWQYAIDPSTLKFSNVPPTSGKLPSPIFDSGMSPLSITVTACPITWEIAGDTFAAAPPTSPACTGGHTTLTLTPFGSGSTKITEVDKTVRSYAKQDVVELVPGVVFMDNLRILTPHFEY